MTGPEQGPGERTPGQDPGEPTPGQGPAEPTPARTPERRAWERERFLARIRSLSRAEVIALGAAVDALVAEGGDAKRLTRGFQLAWYAGPRLFDEESADLDRLFVDIVVAMARAVTGMDPQVVAEAAGRPSGLSTVLLGVFFPRRIEPELTDVSVRLIRGAVAPADPRMAIVAAWNAGCAIALRGRLAPEVDTILTAAWRRGLGELPV